jgi:RNA polymerase sigma-B factor
MAPFADRSFPPAPADPPIGDHTARDDVTAALFGELAEAATPAQRDAVVERICLLYLDLCTTLAGRYTGRGVEHDDLVQVARLSLVAAVGRYRPDRGTSFAAYAVPTITGELKRHFRDKAWLVRPPRRLQELRADAAAHRERLEQCFGRPVSDTELARSLSTTRSDVREAVATSRCYQGEPLEHRIREDDDQPLERSIAYDDADLVGADDRVWLGAAVRHLPSEDRDLLHRRFVDDLSQREIGEALGVSQMQVSRSLRRVLRTLRERIA